MNLTFSSKVICAYLVASSFTASLTNAKQSKKVSKNAKNDPFRNGCVLVAVANGSDTCPVQKMKQWLLIRGRKDGKGPLFKLNARDGV